MREKLFSGYGAVIKKYRRKAKLGQKELAEQMSVTRNTVINWEAERSQPDMLYLRQLCETLCIPLNELFDMPDESNYSIPEKEIIDIFREMSPLGQKIILQQIIAFRDVEAEETTP